MLGNIVGHSVKRGKSKKKVTLVGFRERGGSFSLVGDIYQSISTYQKSASF